MSPQTTAIVVWGIVYCTVCFMIFCLICQKFNKSKKVNLRKEWFWLLVSPITIPLSFFIVTIAMLLGKDPNKLQSSPVRNHTPEIQNVTRDIYKGICLAKDFIRDEGVENAQLETFLLAKGLFAVGFIHEAYFWLQKTEADPVNRIPLMEKMERRLGMLPVVDVQSSL